MDDLEPRSPQPFLGSVVSASLRRVIIEVRGRDMEFVQWTSLDENLVDLVERHKAYGNLVPQISTIVDPEKIRGLLPRAAQEGVLEVRLSERPDYWA